MTLTTTAPHRFASVVVGRGASVHHGVFSGKVDTDGAPLYSASCGAGRRGAAQSSGLASDRPVDCKACLKVYPRRANLDQTAVRARKRLDKGDASGAWLLLDGARKTDPEYLVGGVFSWSFLLAAVESRQGDQAAPVSAPVAPVSPAPSVQAAPVSAPPVQGDQGDQAAGLALTVTHGPGGTFLYGVTPRYGFAFSRLLNVRTNSGALGWHFSKPHGVWIMDGSEGRPFDADRVSALVAAVSEMKPAHTVTVALDAPDMLAVDVAPDQAAPVAPVQTAPTSPAPTGKRGKGGKRKGDQAARPVSPAPVAPVQAAPVSAPPAPAEALMTFLASAPAPVAERAMAEALRVLMSSVQGDQAAPVAPVQAAPVSAPPAPVAPVQAARPVSAPPARKGRKLTVDASAPTVITDASHPYAGKVFRNYGATLDAPTVKGLRSAIARTRVDGRGIRANVLAGADMVTVYVDMSRATDQAAVWSAVDGLVATVVK